MSKRSTPLRLGNRDGTSQRSRRLAALDPAYAAIDERTSADLLTFVQAYAEQVHYFDAAVDDGATGGEQGAEVVRAAGTWSEFARRPDLSIADVLAYVADPTRFTGDAARWLGRPHYTLLLTFIELLGRARDQLNGFTRRHLDYYYRDVLRMLPGAPVADRTPVVLELRPGVADARLPAGTELQGGRDDKGTPRIYLTERELVVNRASVAEVRSVFVDRRITGIPDVRRDRSLTAAEALDKTVAIALGSPRPGDPIPAWDGKPVDSAFLLGLRPTIDFAWTDLHLRQHELRSLMRLVRQRAAGVEWPEINRLLGVNNPSDPRDFAGNLAARVGTLDFQADGLPQVSNIDDLYAYRTEPDVRDYIDEVLDLALERRQPPAAPIGYANFAALMPIKLRVDAEWAEINRLLERIGRRQRGLLQWSLPPGRSTDFAFNLHEALDGKWPPVWPGRSAQNALLTAVVGAVDRPWDTKSLDDYEALIRRLETHLSMPIERIDTLVAFAESVVRDAKSEAHDWSEVDRLLADAHREKLAAARRATLAAARAGHDDAQGFDAEASLVLGEAAPIAWSAAGPRLAAYLDRPKLDMLGRFRDGLGQWQPAGFGWADVDRLFEEAWRRAQELPDPVALRTEARNVYAWDDATRVSDGAGTSPGWKTFGQRPDDATPDRPLGATLGWGLRSPLLSLSEGRRTLTLTLGLSADGFDMSLFLAAIGAAGKTSGAPLVTALQAALAVQVTTAKGWIDTGISAARAAGGPKGDDYWTLLGVPRAADKDRPALQLTLSIDASRDPIEPLPGGAAWPELRLTLRPSWDKAAKEWRTLMEAFEPVVLAAVHLKVEVQGLVALHLQQEDSAIDAKKPFEPFGSQPFVGSRLYLSHPELVRARLDKLRFDVEWMGLPASLKDAYYNYPGVTGGGVFQAQVVLVDRNLDLPLGGRPLFEDADGKTKPSKALDFTDVPGALQAAAPGWAYTSRSDLTAGRDVRDESRHFRWDLSPVDFGHSIHLALASAKARDLAVGIAGGTVKTPEKAAEYRVDPPYTPTIKRLTAAYTTTIELVPGAAAADHVVLHVHPFGACPIDAAEPTLVPRYPTGGELYVGVRDLDAPRHLSLLVQLAEGSSDPDLEPAPITWSYLAGDRFADLAGGGIIADETRGLINSGIVELALPAAAAGTRLPGDLYWLRVSIPRNTSSVCDTVALRAQAVMARFDDRGNAPSHYDQPLPGGSIDRLLEPDARIAAIDQPYTSFGGKPPEQTAQFDVRVSERLRHKQRALAAWDYERLVLQEFQQIYKAKCLAGERGAVNVIVIPDIRALRPSNTFAPKAPANLLADIQAYLAARAPASARVRVRNAQYVSVQVRLGVRFRAGLEEGYAMRRLNDDLVRFLSPWAFDDGAEVTIGGKIYANSILDFADRRDYVDYVAEIKLFRSLDGKDYDMVVPDEGYHVATDRPDQVLVAAPQHYFDLIPETGFQEASFTGINYARIELDFIVA